MKKVRKKDLIMLIASHYREFIDSQHKPINDIIDEHGDIQIDIDSIYIRVRDINKKGLFNEISEFARNIETITFGNLKVIRTTDDEMFIANAYEIIDYVDHIYCR